MAALIRATRSTLNIVRQVPASVRLMSDEYGSGAGKGGGAGGSIRSAGGSFGKMEAAHEEEYFRKLQVEQLKEMKESMDDMLSYHSLEIKHHQQARQLEEMKNSLKEMVSQHKKEIKHHEQAQQLQEMRDHLNEEIKQHEEAIARHKEKINQIKHKEDKSDSD